MSADDLLAQFEASIAALEAEHGEEKSGDEGEKVESSGDATSAGAAATNADSGSGSREASATVPKKKKSAVIISAPALETTSEQEVATPIEPMQRPNYYRPAAPSVHAGVRSVHGVATASAAPVAAPNYYRPKRKRPEETPSVDARTVAGRAASAAAAGSAAAQKPAQQKPKKKRLRYAAGKIWVDPTLDEWPEDDFRVFIGNLGKDVNDALLNSTFGIYESFAKARVIRDKQTKHSKGYGFLSFLDPYDGARALKEFDGKYVGTQPVTMKKCKDSKRDLATLRKQKKELLLDLRPGRS